MQGKILVIDDDKSIRNVIGMMLEVEGFKVHTASDGMQGLDFLRTGEQVDLIVLDLVMPELDGFEFIECLKQEANYANIPIFVITASNGLLTKIPPDMKHMAKPFDVDQFLATVKECTRVNTAAA